MNPIINAQNLNLGYNNDIIIKNANFKIFTKDFVFISGASGSGKSTLMRSMYGDLPLKSGSLEICGVEMFKVNKKNIEILRRHLGIVFQDYKLLQNQSVYDNIAYVIRTLGISSSEIRNRVTGALKVVGLLDKAKAKPSELSGGEQQRVSIARALVNGPPLLIADEPTGNLDPKNSLEIMQILEQINQRGITVIVSTHDYTLVDRFRKRVLTLEKGEIIRDIQAGTYGQ